MEPLDDGNSFREEEGRSLLESIIYEELPDVEIEWDYDQGSMEHSCKISHEHGSRLYTFTKEMLIDFSMNREKSGSMIRGIVAEIKRYLL